MGATRKLQGEIDKVLKKVQEGVDLFDSIWNKVYDTENANQKEKFEADLKKEIKKLQRYRDQIKTWIQSSEIKDKKALLDARKLIEREMERFKVCEKETKTKAFSKEGLGQQPKTDPREKAKGEAREWLNAMVSELESQVDSFEAEMEGLPVKKGKSRPPQLIHLEESIARHKAHIVKLEQILRLLDNDGLSPDQVNDVKDLVEDYVERNQIDFDEFSEVDEIYSSIPLEKIEALESLDAALNIGSAVSIKDKVMKDMFQPAPDLDENIVQGGIDSGARTPPIQPDVLVEGISASSVATPVSIPLTNGTRGMGIGSPIASSTITITKSNTLSVPSSPVSFSSTVKEEASGSYVAHSGNLSRSVGKDIMTSNVISGQSSPLVSVGMVTSGLSGSALAPTSGHGVGASMPDLSKRSGLASDERLNGGLAQQLTSPSSSQNRVFLQSSTKLVDASGMPETGSSTEGGFIGSRIGQWRPPTASSFQSPEPGQFLARTEIAPDQKQKFLQRLQQVSQQQHNNPLLVSAQQISQLAAATQKQQQLQQLQNQQVSLLQASQNVPLQQQQIGLPLGVQGQAISTTASPSQSTLQQQGLQAQQPSPAQAQQMALTAGATVKENESASARIGELPQQNPQVKSSDYVKNDTAPLNASYTRPVFKIDDDLKNSDTFDVPVGGPGTLAELSLWSSNVESAAQPMQPTQPSTGPGIIGRRSGSDLGAIGDNLISTGAQDQLSNLHMLEAAFHKLPSAKDSERSRSYIPSHPAVTPSSYPQTPLQIIDNPAFWERLDTDVLFFAFYYQQGTYQQYLAARELKKQSWRYHKKYNTWFQRHEEPKVTTDEYEQGTYVYFDFHIVHDDFHQGWCQRIKTEFTFEYSYLEDELVV